MSKLIKSKLLKDDRARLNWMYDNGAVGTIINKDTPAANVYPVVAVGQVINDVMIEVLYVTSDDFVPVKVGDGATAFVGSDRYPYTVVEVVSDKKLVLQADDYKRTDKNGISESQTYEYTPNTKSELKVVTLRKNGRWVEQGQPANYPGFFIGDRSAYQDPSF